MPSTGPMHEKRQSALAAAEISDVYSGTGHSYQTKAIDLELADGAGSDTGTNPKFLAPLMGNLLGGAVDGEGNYLGGLIGAISITGADSDWPVAGVLGVLMDGAKGIDSVVHAHVDGSDPSSETNVNAMFGVSFANNDDDTAINYGLDLYAPANAHVTGAPALAYEKADIRLSNEVCVITSASTPVDYTDGTPPATGEGYAAKGSLCMARDTGKWYTNKGTKAQPIWGIFTSA